MHAAQRARVCVPRIRRHTGCTAGPVISPHWHSEPVPPGVAGPAAEADLAPRFVPGQRVGGYRLLARVGAGGTAEVFQAEELSTGRVVAFKTALPRLRGNAQLAQRSRRETRIALRLAHANIVRVYDAGEHAGVPFLVMEWLAGDNLRAHLATRGSLEPAEALSLMLPIFDAVSYGHGMGVIHRDIKLDNVVLHRQSLEDGSFRVVPKLVDFGVSRLIGATALTLDARCSLLGTPQYMAPEQARGESLIGPAADQHGLAVALYVLLSGHFPRAGANLSELVARVALDGFVPLRKRAPSIDSELAAIVERGMALEPAQRFPSVDAFAGALRDWLRRFEERTWVEPGATLFDASTPWLRGIGGESGRHLEVPHPRTWEPLRVPERCEAGLPERTLASSEMANPDAPDSAPRSSLSQRGSLLQVSAPRRGDLLWFLVAGLLMCLVALSLVLSAGGPS